MGLGPGKYARLGAALLGQCGFQEVLLGAVILLAAQQALAGYYESAAHRVSASCRTAALATCLDPACLAGIQRLLLGAQASANYYSRQLEILTRRGVRLRR